MIDGWSIGPDVASLEVKAVAGLPVSWILTPLPDNWTPIMPVFNVSLPNDAIKSFPLTYGPLDGEDVWYVILTGEQTEELKHAAYVQLVDSGYPIAAGRYFNLTGWSPNVTPVSMPARIIGAPIVGGPGTVSDATTTVKGVVQLAGDLSGTADEPTVPGLAEKADAVHGHVLADISDYTAPDLSGLVETTDPRLFDARTPTAHYHSIGGVDGLQAALDGKQAAGSYAAASHGHTLDDATDTATRVAMTPTERTKLDGIAAGAEVNVNADWDASSGDAQILNKPTIPTPPPDASTTVKGVVRLSGDLAGTADNPTVPGLADKANTSHTHAAGDIASGTLAIARIPTGTTSSTVALGNHSHTAAAVGAAPAGHEHLAGQVLQQLNYQTGSSYTLVYADIGKLVCCDSSSPFTLTVPSGVFSTGQRADVMQAGAGAVTVVGSGVTLLAPPGMTLVSEGQNALFTLLFVAPTVAVVAGWMVRA